MPVARAILVGAALAVTSTALASEGVAPCQGVGIAPAPEGALDPRLFFDRLVDRYRGLIFYSDRVRVVQVTQRPHAEAERVETQIACEVREGRLKVATPASQVRDRLGLNAPMRTAPAMDDLELRYGLWLAPHMALKFTDEPLKQLREGVEEGFTPTDAKSVTINERPLVNLELKSGGDEREEAEARVNLYVDPDSMLIERIESEQRLPDGASYQTTLEIDHVAEVEPLIEPSLPAEPPMPVPSEPEDDIDWGEPRPDVSDPAPTPPAPAPPAASPPAGSPPPA